MWSDQENEECPKHNLVQVFEGSENDTQYLVGFLNSFANVLFTESQSVVKGYSKVLFFKMVLLRLSRYISPFRR